MGSGPNTPPPPSGPGRGLMDEWEVASYLRIPIDTFRKMRAKRKCPRITKVGRHLRWDPADVDAWIEAQKEPAPVVKSRFTVVNGGQAA